MSRAEVGITDERRQLIARRIREAREDLGLTQSDLALQLQTYPSTLSRYETGNRIPGPRQMRQLSKALGKPIPYLRASDLEEELNGAS